MVGAVPEQVFVPGAAAEGSQHRKLAAPASLAARASSAISMNPADGAAEKRGSA